VISLGTCERSPPALSSAGIVVVVVGAGVNVDVVTEGSVVEETELDDNSPTVDVVSGWVVSETSSKEAVEATVPGPLIPRSLLPHPANNSCSAKTATTRRESTPKG